MRKDKLYAAALTSALIMACGGEPTGPIGPSGGDNRFRVFIDQDKEPFDTVSLSVVDTSTTVVTLRMSGAVDPLPDAVDDEYSLQLAIELDREGLLAMSAPDTIILKGETSFTPDQEVGAFERVEHHPDPSASPMLRGLFFRRSCFCADMDAGEQSYEGTLQVEQIAEDEITGTLSVRLTGDVPNYDVPLDATVEAEFNLAIP